MVHLRHGISYPQARAVRCPACNAAPRWPCRYTGGPRRGDDMSVAHDSRYLAAVHAVNGSVTEFILRDISI